MLRLIAAMAPPIALVMVGVLLLEPPALTPRERLPTLRLLTGPGPVDPSPPPPEATEGADSTATVSFSFQVDDDTVFQPEEANPRVRDQDGETSDNDQEDHPAESSEHHTATTSPVENRVGDEPDADEHVEPHAGLR